jgi:integrase
VADFLTVTAHGKVRYKARVRKVVDGRTITRTKTLGSISDAKKWAAKIEQQLERQDAALLTEAELHTVKDAIGAYRDGDPQAGLQSILATLKPSTRIDYRRHLEYWEERIGTLKLAQLTPARLDKERDHLLASKTPATSTRYLATLSAVLTACVERWHWLTENPLRQVAKPAAAPSRTMRFLSPEEARSLLAAAALSKSKDLHLAVLLSLTTGARAGETLGLRWEHVDLERGVALLPDTKNSEPRTLALTPEAIELLTARRQKRLAALKEQDPAATTVAGLVFPSREDPEKPVWLRNGWVQALKRAGISNFRWHDQRHSVASFLAARGASLKQIGSVLGHRSVAATAIYAHLSQDHAHQLARSMAAEVLTEPEPKAAEQPEGGGHD